MDLCTSLRVGYYFKYAFETNTFISFCCQCIITKKRKRNWDWHVAQILLPNTSTHQILWPHYTSSVSASTFWNLQTCLCHHTYLPTSYTYNSTSASLFTYSIRYGHWYRFPRFCSCLTVPVRRLKKMELSRPVNISTTSPTEGLETNYKEHKQTWAGGLHTVLSMQGGDDEGSYAKNSEAAASAVTLSKPLLLTAIQSLNLKLFTRIEEEKDCCIGIADLGCATGYNTLATIDMVVECLRKQYIHECGFEPEFEAFFSDLPSNDFNSLFRSLPAATTRHYYAAGVPGSFYGRLFPKRKLHVVVSLSALQWLSQVLIKLTNNI